MFKYFFGSSMAKEEIKDFFNIVLELAGDYHFAKGMYDDPFNNLNDEKMELLEKGFQNIRMEETPHWSDSNFKEYEKETSRTKFGLEEKKK